MKFRILGRPAINSYALIIQADGINRSDEWTLGSGAVHSTHGETRRIFFMTNARELRGNGGALFTTGLFADLVADAP